MLCQMSHRGQVDALLHDELQDGKMNDLANILQPAVETSDLSPAPMDSSGITAVFKKASDLPQDAYDALLDYLQATGHKYQAYDAFSPSSQCSYSSSKGWAPLQVHQGDHTFSCQHSHWGNSAIQFWNPYRGLYCPPLIPAGIWQNLGNSWNSGGINFGTGACQIDYTIPAECRTEFKFCWNVSRIHMDGMAPGTTGMESLKPKLSVSICWHSIWASSTHHLFLPQPPPPPSTTPTTVTSSPLSHLHHCHQWLPPPTSVAHNQDSKNDVAMPHHQPNEHWMHWRCTTTWGIQGATSLAATWQPHDKQRQCCRSSLSFIFLHGVKSRHPFAPTNIANDTTPPPWHHTVPQQPPQWHHEATPPQDTTAMARAQHSSNDNGAEQQWCTTMTTTMPHLNPTPMNTTTMDVAYKIQVPCHHQQCGIQKSFIIIIEAQVCHHPSPHYLFSYGIQEPYPIPSLTWTPGAMSPTAT